VQYKYSTQPVLYPGHSCQELSTEHSFHAYKLDETGLWPLPFDMGFDSKDAVPAFDSKDVVTYGEDGSQDVLPAVDWTPAEEKKAKRK
jgi:hypothetical protein